MVIPVLRELRQIKGELRVNLQHGKILSKIIYQSLSNALCSIWKLFNHSCPPWKVTWIYF